MTFETWAVITLGLLLAIATFGFIGDWVRLHILQAKRSECQVSGQPMQWTVFEDKHTPGDWRVEAIDHENEGAVYVAIFSGPLARERAEAYALDRRLPYLKPHMADEDDAADLADHAHYRLRPSKLPTD